MHPILFLLTLLLTPAPPSGDYLTHPGDANKDKMMNCEGWGYAVQFEVPDSSRTYYAKSVRIFGESFGQGYDHRKTFFTLSFMDLEGNFYGDSEHCYGDHFTNNQVTWATVKFTPVEVPPVFWVIVDFHAAPNKGVYLGFLEGGEVRSKLVDANGLLQDIGEDWNWAVQVEVDSEVQGERIAYDPSNYTRKAVRSGEEKPHTFKKKSRRVEVSVTGLKEGWTDTLIRVTERIMHCYEERYGLRMEDPLRIEARIDESMGKTGMAFAADGSLRWNLKNTHDLLPLSRGGEHCHLFDFCRVLAEKGLANTLVQSEFAPKGQEAALVAKLASSAVRDLCIAFGKDFWPIPFDYYKEEGPTYAAQWEKIAGGGQEEVFSSLFAQCSKQIGEGPFSNTLKKVFEGKPEARYLMRTLYETMKADGRGEWCDALFTEALLKPPMLWLYPRPDFQNPAVFSGLEIKRYKEAAILNYGDGAADGGDLAGEEEIALYFPLPEGAWRIDEIRIFARRTGEGPLEVKVLDGDLKPLAAAVCPVDAFGENKPSWEILPGFKELALGSPFFLAFHGEGIEVGLDAVEGPSHSVRIKPGVHVAPLSSNSEWMVRLYIAPVGEMDRKALARAVSDLKRRINP